LRFTALQTPNSHKPSRREAVEFLASHHIHDEAVTWQPPATLLAGLSPLVELPAGHTVHETVPAEFAAAVRDSSARCELAEPGDLAQLSAMNRHLRKIGSTRAARPGGLES
jgi:hypothetical protein